MLLTGRDDIRNRIPPRLRDFYTNEENVWENPTQGDVNWYKAHMLKTYCQETNGYVCQRPVASNYGIVDAGSSKYFTVHLQINCFGPEAISFYDKQIIKYFTSWNVFAAYRGCYSKSNIPSGTSAIYASKTSMTVGFCIQLCMADASDPSNEPKFIALSVRI